MQRNNMNLVTFPTKPVQAKLSDIAWLSGSWRGMSQEGWELDENWSQARNGLLVGIATTFQDGVLKYSDATWITERAGLIESHFRRFDKFFMPYSHLAEPDVFCLVRVTQCQLIFHSAEVDGGAWMEYERNGDQLKGCFWIGSEPNPISKYTLHKF